MSPYDCSLYLMQFAWHSTNGRYTPTEEVAHALAHRVLAGQTLRISTKKKIVVTTLKQK
jgi:hypothetical protein